MKNVDIRIFPDLKHGSKICEKDQTKFFSLLLASWLPPVLK